MAHQIDNDSPSTPHPGVARMRPAWSTCRDLMGGTRAVRAARTTYLPKHPKEHDDDYAARLKGSELYNGFKRTVAAVTGLAFQSDPVLSEDAPEPFTQAWENIDGRGTHGAVFARRLFRDGIVTGLNGILVDYPSVANPKALSLADERALGLRAYWVHIRAEQIVSWRTATVNGETILTQLVIREDVEEAVGLFGTAYVTYYRVWKRAVLRSQDAAGLEVTVASTQIEWQLWKESGNDASKRTELNSSGVIEGIDEIPFSPNVPDPEADGFESTPPLADLADVNLAHYRVQSDRRWVLHLACVPVPVRKGYRPPVEGGSEMTIGPAALQDLPSDGDFFWRSPDGTAFTPTKEELDALERRMGQLGLAFLAPDTRAAETAEAKRIDSQAQNATLAAAVRALSDCLENAAKLHAKFAKLDGTPGITVNTDFERLVMDTGLAQMLSTMEASGQLTLETLFDLLKRGHVLPDDFDGEDEQEKLAQRARAMAAELTKPGADRTDDEDEPPAPSE